MPFISPVGNLEIADDVSRLVFDSDLQKHVFVEKEFDDALTLTDQGAYTYDAKTDNHIQHVFEGEPLKDMFCFKESHMWRVMTQNFLEKDEDDKIIGPCDVSWWRFYRKYRDSLTGRMAKKFPNYQELVKYVPSYDDFQVVKYGPKANFHFPVWILEMMKADGILARFKNSTRPGSRGQVRYCTDEQLEEMLDILEERKNYEGVESPFMEDFKKMKKKEAVQKSNSARKRQNAMKKLERDMLNEQGAVDQKAEEEAAKKKAQEEKKAKELEEVFNSIPEQNTDDVEDNIELTAEEEAQLASIFGDKGDDKQQLPPSVKGDDTAKKPKATGKGRKKTTAKA